VQNSLGVSGKMPQSFVAEFWVLCSFSFKKNKDNNPIKETQAEMKLEDATLALQECQ